MFDNIMNPEINIMKISLDFIYNTLLCNVHVI